MWVVISVILAGDKMKGLEHYFKEEDWTNYSNMFGKEWTNSDFQLKLLKLCNGNLDVAKVIYGHMDDESLAWMVKKVPALEYLTPLECLQDKDLIKRLKVCLHRFPF